MNWALARRHDWRIVLRIEDLDTPRNKPDAQRDAMEALAWLGLDWDEGPIIQSHDLEPHREAMRRLAAEGAAYPCELSRAEIRAAASAPQESQGQSEIGEETRFPAELRPELGPRSFTDALTNWRFRTPDETVTFDDRFAGLQQRSPAESVGDFTVWTSRGQPSYQLAVVVDDARQGVTEIVRGNDLLDSAARQMLIARALGIASLPNYCHLPLVRGEDGRRLAKRHGDTRIARYRQGDRGPERLIGLLAYWCGVTDHRTAMGLGEFLERFDLDRMPRNDVVFGPEDDTWLLG